MDNETLGSWSITDSMPVKGACLLDELSVLEVTGDDAAHFLHGQFTNHINNIDDHFRLAAYCQPQGRVLALMRVAKVDNTFYLVLPKDLVSGFVKRLSMFILRSDVKISVADRLAVCGLIDCHCKLPEIDRILIDRDCIIARTPDWDNKKRALVIGAKETLERIFKPNQSSALWFESEIEAGMPWIFEKTREAFIPQWINLDLIGGLVFDKGCYPGQEVISRVQHIGSTPRRMVLATSEAAVSCFPNDEVFQNGQSVGNVVMSFKTESKTMSLIEVTLKSMETGKYQINNVEFSVEISSF